MTNFLFHKAPVYYSYLFTFVFLAILQTYSASTVESINAYTGRTDSQTLGHISELDVNSDVQEDLSLSAKEKLHRHRRYITLNIFGEFNVGFLIVVPISIIIPSMTNLFNKWRRRRSVTSENEDIQVYQDSPAVEHHLNKIATYFNLLEIPENSCHVRAICEFSAEPEKYYPISNMILRRLRDPILPSFLAYGDSPMSNSTHNPTEPKSLYRIYNNAADIGQAYGMDSCQKNYGGGCRYSMDKLLSMPVLKFWSGLADMLKLTFTDDDNDNISY